MPKIKHFFLYYDMCYNILNVVIHCHWQKCQVFDFFGNAMEKLLLALFCYSTKAAISIFCFAKLEGLKKPLIQSILAISFLFLIFNLLVFCLFSQKRLIFETGAKRCIFFDFIHRLLASNNIRLYSFTLRIIIPLKAPCHLF